MLIDWWHRREWMEACRMWHSALMHFSVFQCALKHSGLLNTLRFHAPHLFECTKWSCTVARSFAAWLVRLDNVQTEGAFYCSSLIYAHDVCERIECMRFAFELLDTHQISIQLYWNLVCALKCFNRITDTRFHSQPSIFYFIFTKP